MRPNHWLEEDAARTAAPLTLALDRTEEKRWLCSIQT